MGNVSTGWGYMGLIGSLERAVLARFTWVALFQRHVWFLCSYLSLVRSHTSTPLHPTCLCLLDFHFPLDAGRLNAWRECFG